LTKSELFIERALKSDTSLEEQGQSHLAIQASHTVAEGVRNQAKTSIKNNQSADKEQALPPKFRRPSLRIAKKAVGMYIFERS
jgi:hypothetical protein